MSIFPILFSLVLTLNAFAGPGTVGNGGDGVEIDGKLYLLDLVEFGGREGDHITPHIDPSIEPRESDLERLSALDSLNDSGVVIDKREIAAKLAEIRAVNPGLAEALLRVIGMYEWEYSNYPLVDVGDENTKVNLPRVQLGIRQRTRIDTAREALLRLQQNNRTAYVFHEIVYALVRPTPIVTNGERPLVAQRSSVARQITAYLFSRKLKERGNAGLLDAFKIPPVADELVDETAKKTKVGDYYLPISTYGRLDPNLTGDETSVALSLVGYKSKLSGIGESGVFKREYDRPFAIPGYSTYSKPTFETLIYSCKTHVVEPYSDKKYKRLVPLPAALNIIPYGVVATLSLSRLPESDDWYIAWTIGESTAGKPVVVARINDFGKIAVHREKDAGIPSGYIYQYSLRCTELLRSALKDRGVSIE